MTDHDRSENHEDATGGEVSAPIERQLRSVSPPDDALRRAQIATALQELDSVVATVQPPISAGEFPTQEPVEALSESAENVVHISAARSWSSTSSLLRFTSVAAGCVLLVGVGALLGRSLSQPNSSGQDAASMAKSVQETAASNAEGDASTLDSAAGQSSPVDSEADRADAAVSANPQASSEGSEAPASASVIAADPSGIAPATTNQFGTRQELIDALASGRFVVPTPPPAPPSVLTDERSPCGVTADAVAVSVGNATFFVLAGFGAISPIPSQPYFVVLEEGTCTAQVVRRVEAP